MNSFMYSDMLNLFREKLSERELLVLGLKLQGYTLGQIGDVLGGISKERVRQVEHKAWAIILYSLKRKL